MSKLAVNGVEFAHTRRGTGEMVVLVHGAIGDMRTWENQLPRLSAKYEVIAYSRRGHFPCTHIPPGTTYTVESHAQDLLALIQSLGSPVRLVGHSYGGAICAVVALMCPQLVRSLVLAEPSLFTLLFTQREGAMALAESAAAMTHVTARIREGRTEPALDDYLNVILGPGGAAKITGFSRRVMLANAHTIEPMLNGMSGSGQFTAAHAAQIKVPTLLLTGEHTPAFFRLTAETLAKTIPAVQQVVIPGISHGLQLEAPDEFSQAVLEFFARH